MAARTKTANRQSRLLFAAGPFKGVKTVLDAPYQDANAFLAFAQNGYMRDVKGLSSWLARAGLVLTSNSQMGTGQRMQGAHLHVDPATGAFLRFFVVNGVLYKSDTSMSVFTAITLAGVAIDTATPRVSFLSVGSSLVVNDGVNRPWFTSDPHSALITGAYIDIDGAGGAWTAFGPPTIYQDSVFFITATVPGGSAVDARIGIVWSEPNQPGVGYDQSGYADFWNFIETGSDPLYAILGTNNGLFIWRENAITVAAGTPSINFSSTATRDARGVGVGTLSPWTVAIFQSNIFFIDAQLRPWMMTLTGEPQPIWTQSVISVGPKQPADITNYAVAAIAPEINQYIVAYQIVPSGLTNSPTSASCFDASTGTYGGEWVVSSGSGFDVLAEQRDATNLPCLVACGGLSASAPSGGYVHQLYPLNGSTWGDTGQVTSQNSVTTKVLGYTADSMLLPDRVVVVARSAQAMTMVVETTAGSYTLSGTPLSPAATLANFSTQFRIVFYLDGSATRSLVLTLQGNASPTRQWGVQRIEVYGTSCAAGPEDT